MQRLRRAARLRRGHWHGHHRARRCQTRHLHGGYLRAILALLRQYGLPTETDFTCDALTDAALSDKKIADGKLHLIVPERIGHCRIETIPAADIRAWLADGGIA